MKKLLGQIADSLIFQCFAAKEIIAALSKKKNKTEIKNKIEIKIK